MLYFQRTLRKDTSQTLKETLPTLNSTDKLSLVLKVPTINIEYKQKVFYDLSNGIDRLFDPIGFVLY